MKRDSFKLFHWEFYKDEGDSYTYVYETRSGDIIGYIQDMYDLNTIRKIFDSNIEWYTEEDVNTFIEDNIIWF